MDEHAEEAVLSAYGRYALSVSPVTADRCALAFRAGFLAGYAEVERMRAALVRIEDGYHRRLSAAELASMARQALSI